MPTEHSTSVGTPLMRLIAWMRRKYALARHDEFLRKVMVLFAGTSVAQLVPLLASLILTRLFSPSDFGTLGIFAAILTITAVFGSMRFEHGVLIEAENAEAMSVARSSMLVCLLISTTSVLAVLLFASAFANAIGQIELKTALWMLPPALLLTATIQVWSLWLLRCKQYKNIASARVLQSLAVAGAMIAFGIVGGDGNSLVVSTIIGQTVSLMWFWKSEKGQLPLPTVTPQVLSTVLRRYWRFPVFTVPADLLSAAAAQLPMFVLAPKYGIAVAGYFLLTQRVLGAPLAVIGSAVMDAYKQDAAAAYAATRNCRELTLRIVRQLIGISIVPWLVAVAFAPVLFQFIFGKEWLMAGEIAQLMATPYFLRLITTPVSYNFYLSGRQNEDLFVQGYNLFSAMSILWLMHKLNAGVVQVVAAYAANLTIVYSYYLFRSIRLSRANDL